MTKRLSKEDFETIYCKVPRLCVDLAIQMNGGTLLTKRNIEPWKGLWHFPGGSVLLGETLEEAGKRIAKEELNLDIEIIRFLQTIEYPSKEKKGYKQPISLLYYAEPKSKEIKLDKNASEITIYKEGFEGELINEIKEPLKRIL